MDNTKTIEKPHEQVQLCSLTRNAGKENSTKQNISFADNRAAAQRQRNMVEVMQRAVHLSSTYRANVPNAQAEFQTLDNNLRNSALPNAQLEFTQKFGKNVSPKPRFIRDVENNDQQHMYMSWGKFIEWHLNYVVDQTKFWNRQIKFPNGSIPDYGRYSGNNGLFADLTSPDLGDGSHITGKLTKHPPAPTERICAVDITYNNTDMTDCISQKIPIPQLGYQPQPMPQQPGYQPRPMPPYQNQLFPPRPINQPPLMAPQPGYQPQPFPYAVDENGNRVDMDEWRREHPSPFRPNEYQFF